MICEDQVTGKGVLWEVNSDPRAPKSPDDPESRVPGRMCSGLRTMAPQAPEYPEDPRKIVPRESAQDREQRPPSTRFPEDLYSQFRERVLGTANSSPRALGSLRTKKGYIRERVLGAVNSDPRALGSPTA